MLISNFTKDSDLNLFIPSYEMWMHENKFLRVIYLAILDASKLTES